VPTYRLWAHSTRLVVPLLLPTQGGYVHTSGYTGRHTHRYTPREAYPPLYTKEAYPVYTHPGRHTPYIPTLGGMYTSLYTQGGMYTSLYTQGGIPPYIHHQGGIPPYIHHQGGYVHLFHTQGSYVHLFHTQGGYTPVYTTREAIPLYIPPGRLCYTLCTPREAMLHPMYTQGGIYPG